MLKKILAGLTLSGLLVAVGCHSSRSNYPPTVVRYQQVTPAPCPAPAAVVVPAPPPPCIR